MEFPSSDDESERSKKMKGELLDLLVQNTNSPHERKDPTKYERMLELYGDGLSHAAESPNIGTNAVEFHEVVVTALRLCAKGWPLATKQEVRAGLVAERERDQRTQLSNQAIDQAIDFGLRTWLMFDCSPVVTVGKVWRWPKDMSICAFVEEFVNGCFSPESSSRDQTTKKFPRKFTARNIHDIAGIKIRWTDFLSDHLAFSEEGGRNGTLSIFRQKRWLLEMEKLSSLNASNDQIGSMDADEPRHHGAVANTGTAPDAGTMAAKSGKDKEPSLQKNNDETSGKSIANMEDDAVVPTSTASETNGHTKRDDTLVQEDERKQDATSKQDDTPKQGEPPKQETPKPITMP